MPVSNLPSELVGETLPGYLTFDREEEYLYAMDTELGIADSMGRPAPRVAKDNNGFPDRPLSIKELEGLNPNSVTNWLRRNQPDVFLQEKEAARLANTDSTPSTTAAAPKGKGSRKSAAHLKTEMDTVEEDIGFIADGPGSGSSRKRKVATGDDDAYRPKGGSRAKRKREDSDKGGPRKKGGARASIGTPS